MPRVLCRLPNASRLISGVAFEPHEGVMLSVEISEEEAANFLRIPGYELPPAPEPVVEETEGEAPAALPEAKAEKKPLRGRAPAKP